MLKARLFRSTVVMATVGVMSISAFAQERPAADLNAQRDVVAPQRDAAALSDEEARINSGAPVAGYVAHPALPTNKVVSDAVTPAADISSGNFGANTGGGTYTFPGTVGIGTTTPATGFNLVNGAFLYDTYLGSASVFGFNYRKARGTAAAPAIVSSGDSTGFFQFQGWDGTAFRQGAIFRAIVDSAPGASSMPTALIFGTTPTGTIASAERMRISSAGNVGIGTSNPTFKLHVVGNAHIQGALTGTNIAATYQDVAEWVPATTNLQPGDVVVLNPEKNNEVMSSNTEYDTRVAGVVSAQPGLTLGVAATDKEMIATTGRVKVHVDATNAPIQVGDLLVTSSKPGVAMKSQPMDINGRKFHQPGTIIGKALEPLAAGQGDILVLLSLQ